MPPLLSSLKQIVADLAHELATRLSDDCVCMPYNVIIDNEPQKDGSMVNVECGFTLSYDSNDVLHVCVNNVALSGGNQDGVNLINQSESDTMLSLVSILSSVVGQHVRSGGCVRKSSDTADRPRLRKDMN